MRYDSGQFCEFDGLDNRKTVYDLFVKMGHNVTDEVASARRDGYLTGLLTIANGPFKAKPMRVRTRNAAEAYNQFIAITGVLGVPIEEAAVLLEEVVRRITMPDKSTIVVG